MNPETIAVLGAQGHFGQHLCARLADIRGDSVLIIPTVDKNSNKEIASRADTVLITVRPSQVEAVLKEIADQLKPGARIVSFAARYPLTSIVEITKRSAARIMADPDWNLCAYVLDEGFSEKEFGAQFARLTRRAPIRLKDDYEINTFSVLLTELLVVSVLKRQGTLLNAAAQLAFIGMKLRISPEELEEFQTQGDPEGVLITAATPGGITEATLAFLRENPVIKPEQLFSSLTARFVDSKL